MALSASEAKSLYYQNKDTFDFFEKKLPIWGGDDKAVSKKELEDLAKVKDPEGGSYEETRKKTKWLLENKDLFHALDVANNPKQDGLISLNDFYSWYKKNGINYTPAGKDPGKHYDGMLNKLTSVIGDGISYSMDRGERKVKGFNDKNVKPVLQQTARAWLEDKKYHYPPSEYVYQVGPANAVGYARFIAFTSKHGIAKKPKDWKPGGHVGKDNVELVGLARELDDRLQNYFKVNGKDKNKGIDIWRGYIQKHGGDQEMIRVIKEELEEHGGIPII